MRVVDTGVRHTCVSALGGLIWWLGSFSSFPVSGETAVYTPIKDNTIYSESCRHGFSNGMGPLFAGRTRGMFRSPPLLTCAAGFRRALIAFDLTNIPSGSEIVSVSLSLTVVQARATGSDNFSLHRLLLDWGEGASFTNLGTGDQAETGDATWTHTFFNTETWAKPGGDFAVQASADTDVVGHGENVWTSTQMANDVKLWVDAAATNFGWIVKATNETGRASARKFGNREGAGFSRPQLTVVYNPPVKMDQVITFLPLPDRTYGDADFDLTPFASASSDLPVDFSILSGPASINGTTLAITGAGTITVRASQGGNAEFKPANPEEQSFFVFSSENRRNWVTRHFADPTTVDDSKDESGDGLPNLLKYAFDLDPMNFNRGVLPDPMIDGSGFLTVKFIRVPRATDLTYTIEVSSDLENWAALVQSIAGATPTGPGFVFETRKNTPVTVTVRDTVSSLSEETRTIRLVVQRRL